MPQPTHDETVALGNRSFMSAIAEKTTPALQEAIDLGKKSFDELLNAVRSTVKGTEREATLEKRLALMAEIYIEAQRRLLSGDKKGGEDLLSRVQSVLQSYVIVTKSAAIRQSYETWKGLLFILGKLIRALGPVAGTAIAGLTIPTLGSIVESAVDAAADAVEPDMPSDDQFDGMIPLVVTDPPTGLLETLTVQANNGDTLVFKLDDVLTLRGFDCKIKSITEDSLVVVDPNGKDCYLDLGTLKDLYPETSSEGSDKPSGEVPPVTTDKPSDAAPDEPKADKDAVPDESSPSESGASADTPTTTPDAAPNEASQ